MRGAGASPVRRSVARGASGPNGPAGWTGCPGRATRPLPGSREDAPGEPRVQRQARLHRQEWHEREPCIALGREVQDVALPALPADQEVEGVLVEVGKRDLEDARGFLRDCRCGQHEQARGQMNRTPHLAVVASNPCAAWRTAHATGEEARRCKGPPASGRHRAPPAGEVAYRHIPGWFPLGASSAGAVVPPAGERRCSHRHRGPEGREPANRRPPKKRGNGLERRPPAGTARERETSAHGPASCQRECLTDS